MSATDELRKLLDERGVEWGNVRNDGSESDYLTEWQLNDRQGYAIAIEWAVDGGLSVDLHRHYLTPEQAVAATLGAGTCRNVSDPPEGFLCSECGWGDFAEPSHLLTGSCYAGLAKGPRYCPNCGRLCVE